MIQSPWSVAVTFLQLKFQDVCIATGSGFFWRCDKQVYLVSNWHNYAGRHPETKQAQHPAGAIPDSVSFSVFRDAGTGQDGHHKLLAERRTVALYDGDMAEARWKQHPTLQSAVDVAAVDVTSLLADVHYRCANELENDADVNPTPSQDAFVIGFPLGIVRGAPIPFWKRATIATEPLVDPGGLPLVYVDAATRSGMSGSIAIVRHVLIGPYKKKDGGEASNSIYAQRDQILGIYSGRLGDDEMKAQLGLVWKRHAIDECVRGSSKGSGLLA